MFLKNLLKFLEETNYSLCTLHLMEDDQKCSGTLVNNKNKNIVNFCYVSKDKMFTKAAKEKVKALPDNTILNSLLEYSAKAQFSILRLDLDCVKSEGSGIAELKNGTPSSLTYTDGTWY